MSPLVQFDRASEVAFFDGWNTTGGPKYPRDNVVRFCLRRFPDRRARANMRALDLGCGGGVHALFMAQEGFDVSACDLSPTAIAVTTKRLIDQGLTAQTCVAALDSLPYETESFDLILCVGVLECTPPGYAEVVMPSVARLLKPKGVSYFVFASDKDYRIDDPHNPFVRRGYSEVEAASLFQMSFPVVELNRRVETERNRSVAIDEWMVTARMY
jgi:SAM-dependent methyltransferase